VKAAIYARCAASAPNEDRIGPQMSFCERLAEKHGFTVVKRFSDRNFGGNNADRPGYREMLVAASDREFEAVFAEDLSRFSRHPRDMVELLGWMENFDIAILTEHFDSRDETQNPFDMFSKEDLINNLNEGFRKEVLGWIKAAEQSKENDK
jgi:DNA invertase Pin-like site-specific DNA recombinase